MSFLDLATLTLHRRHELENRIHEFDQKCDRAINDIKNLKSKANGFTSHLNCDPSELKERFLRVMQKLDEFMYLITDFNLAMAHTVEAGNTDNPVQDTSISIQPSLSPFNLLDALTEPRPAISHACPNLCPPQDTLRINIPKEQEGLITFFSSSGESVPTDVTPNSKENQSSKSEKEVPKSKKVIATSRKEIQKSVRESRKSEKDKLKLEKEKLKIEKVKIKLEKEFQSDIVDNMASLSVDEPIIAEKSSMPRQECCITSAQSVLEVDKQYSATIMAVHGGSFWIVTEDSADVVEFMSTLTNYYEHNHTPVSAHDLANMTCCACSRGGFYFRAMFLKKYQGHEKSVKVYLVDSGEILTVSIENIQPLAKQFCDLPPFARFCHLAGIDIGDDKELMKKQDALINEFLGVPCYILVDDNSSESLGVIVILPSANTTLNDLMVKRGLAVSLDKFSHATPEEQNKVPSGFMAPCSPENYHGFPLNHYVDKSLDSTQDEQATVAPGFLAPDHRESPSSYDVIQPPIRRIYGPPPDNDDELLANMDITQCPEFEDPVLAVTGYHNRDEVDICKHYKGEPGKTCFKGARCTKKHVLHHPDGWTLDKVKVLAKCRSLPLPAPGSWIKVLVTAVCHFDRVYVQFLEGNVDEGIPDFGVVLPPTTLERLRHDMNSPASVQTYKPLTITPAPGEIVAAIYPLDNCWHRARVLTATRHDQSVEVIYVDYGTVLWVKEDQIRELDERFIALPIQAVQCVLGGVRKRGDSATWAAARRALQDAVSTVPLTAHVLAREYDEIIVELFKNADEQSAYNVAEWLAQQQLIDYVQCDPQSDRNVTFKHVVP